MVILQTVISDYYKKTSKSTLPLMFMPVLLMLAVDVLLLVN